MNGELKTLKYFTIATDIYLPEYQALKNYLDNHPLMRDAVDRLNRFDDRENQLYQDFENGLYESPKDSIKQLSYEIKTYLPRMIKDYIKNEKKMLKEFETAPFRNMVGKQARMIIRRYYEVHGFFL